MGHDPFHEGERAVQRRAGVRERLAELGSRVIRDYMPEQHRDFFPLLPWLLVGSVDRSGQPWASVLAGREGFVHSPDPTHLQIDAQPLPADPLHENLRAHAVLGILGLQPHTRRRNRVNGLVETVGAGQFTVAVQQSFGNCPKYIQARRPVFVDSPRASAAMRMAALDEPARHLIANADTFFIATSHPAVAIEDSQSQGEGVDVSHRGGRPGFVRLDGDTLVAPDYTGNFFFNTLGNLMLEPRAGLLFIDYGTGDVLQIAVRASIDWDADALSEFPGAQRLLRMTVTGMIRHSQALPLSWTAAELSPALADF